MQEPYSYRGDPDIPVFLDNLPVILFDGNCVLCSNWANFVLKHDTIGVFRLLTAQSPLGQALYKHYGLNPKDFDSNMLLMDGNLYLKSEACILMAEILGHPWSMAANLRILPLPMRDKLYDYLARNRFRWFGRRQTCYIPSGQHKDRFL